MEYFEHLFNVWKKQYIYVYYIIDSIFKKKHIIVSNNTLLNKIYLLIISEDSNVFITVFLVNSIFCCQNFFFIQQKTKS